MHRRYRILALCLSIAIGFNSVNIYASEVSGNSLDATEDIVQEQNCDDNCTQHDHVAGESNIVDGSDIGHDILGGETSNVVSEVINIGSDGTEAITIDESGVTEDLVGVPEVDVNNVTEDLTSTVSDNSNIVADNSEKSDLTTETESDTSEDDTVVEEKEETVVEEKEEVVEESGDSVSDNNLTTNDDATVSGNDITVSGNDLTVSGNDITVSGNDLEVKSYKVTFVGFDGVEIGTFNTNEKTGDSDELVYPEAPVVDGYKFIGWDSDIKLISEINEDLTITAEYVSIDDLLKLNLVEGKEIVKSVNGREVKVTGTLPDNAELSVTEVTDTSHIENNIINSISKSESGITFETVLSDVVSFDIKIIVEGIEFQPEQFGESVTVTISNISDSGLRLFHDDGNGVEEIGVTIEDSAVFVAESFSTYTFANVTSGIMDVQVGGPKVSGYDCDSYVYGDKWFDNNVVRSIQDAYVFGNHLYFNSIEASDNNLNIAYVLNGDNIVEVIGIKSTLTQDLISTHYDDGNYRPTSNKVWTNTKWHAESITSVNDREIFNIAYLKKFDGVIPVGDLGLVFSDGYLSGDTIKSVTWRTDKITFKDYTSTYSLIPVSDSAPENDRIIPDDTYDYMNNYYWFLIKNQDGTIISNYGLVDTLSDYIIHGGLGDAIDFKFKLNGVELIDDRDNYTDFRAIKSTSLFNTGTYKSIKPSFTFGYSLDESKYTGVAPMPGVSFAKEILMNNYDDTYENITPSTITLDVTLGDAFNGSVEFKDVGQNMNIMKDDTKITFKDDLYLDLTSLDENTVSLSLSSNLNKSELLDFGGGTEYENYMNNKDSKDSIQYKFLETDTKGWPGDVRKENIKLVYYDSSTDEKALIDNTGEITDLVADSGLMSKDMKYFTPLFTCTTLSSDDVDKIKSALEFDNDSKKLYYICNFHGVFGSRSTETKVSQTINSVTRDYNEVDLYIVKEIKAKPPKSKKILTFSDLTVYTGDWYGANYEQLDINYSSWGNRVPSPHYQNYNNSDYRYSSEVDIKIDQNMLKDKVTELGGSIYSSKLDITSVDILTLNENGFPENYRTINPYDIKFNMNRFSKLNGIGDGSWNNPYMNGYNIYDKIGDLTSMFVSIYGFDENVIGNRLLHSDIKLVVNTEFTLTSSNGGIYKETDSFTISQKCNGHAGVTHSSRTAVGYKIIEKNKKQLDGVDVSEYILYFPYSGEYNIIGKLNSCKITRLERNADGSFDDGDVFNSYYRGNSNTSLQITAGYYKFETNSSYSDCIIFEDVGYAGGDGVKFCSGGSLYRGSYRDSYRSIEFCACCNQLVGFSGGMGHPHQSNMSKVDYVYADMASYYKKSNRLLNGYYYPVGWIESESNSEFVPIGYTIGYGTTVLNGNAPSGTFVFNSLSDMSNYKIKITDIYSNDIPTDCVYVNGVNQSGFNNGVEKTISVRKGYNYITVDLNKGSNVGKVSDYKLVVEFMKGDTKSCISNDNRPTGSRENQHLYECSICGAIAFKKEQLNEVTLSPKSTSLVYGSVKEGGVNKNLFDIYIGGAIYIHPSDTILNMSQQSALQYSFTVEVNNTSNSQVTETMFIAMDAVAQLTGNDSYIGVKVNNVDMGDFHAGDSTNGTEIKNKHDLTFNSGLNTMEITFYNIRPEGSKYSNLDSYPQSIKIYMGNGSLADCDTSVANYGYCDICGMLHLYQKSSSHNYVEWGGNVNNVNTTWDYNIYNSKFKKVFNTNTIGTETLETTLELDAGTYKIPYVLNLAGNQYGKFSLILNNTEVFSKVHNSSITGNVELVIPSTGSYDLIFKWESDNSNVADGSYVEVDLRELYYKQYESSYRTPSCTFTRCTKCHDVKTSYGSQLWGSNFSIKTEVTGAQADNTAKFYISFDAVPDGFKDGGAQAGNRYFYPLSVSYQTYKGSSVVPIDNTLRQSYMQNIYDDGTVYSDKLHDLTPIGYGGVIEVANGTTTQVRNMPKDAVFSFEESLKDLNGVSITDTVSGQKYTMSVSKEPPLNQYYAGAYKITLSKNEVVPTGVDVNMTPYVVITLLVVLPYLAYYKCKVKEDSNK